MEKEFGHSHTRVQALEALQLMHRSMERVLNHDAVYFPKFNSAAVAFITADSDLYDKRPPTTSRAEFSQQTLEIAIEMLLWWLNPPTQLAGPVTLTHLAAALEAFERAQTNKAWHRTWFDALLEPHIDTVTTDSLTSPTLLFGRLRQGSRLAPLTDGSRKIIVKTQTLHKPYARLLVELQLVSRERPGMRPARETMMQTPLLGFTQEVLVAAHLRRLVTDWPYMVTPHFTTLIDAFVASVEEELTFCSVYERGTVTLHAYFKTLTRLVTDQQLEAHLKGIYFQIFYSTEAALRLFGFRHGDLHRDNIMLRDVSGTAYANRAWVYYYHYGGDKGVYYVVPPRVHRNLLVEIIDFGRSTFSAKHYTAASAGATLADWVDDALRPAAAYDAEVDADPYAKTVPMDDTQPLPPPPTVDPLRVDRIQQRLRRWAEKIDTVRAVHARGALLVMDQWPQRILDVTSAATSPIRRFDGTADFPAEWRPALLVGVMPHEALTLVDGDAFPFYNVRSSSSTTATTMDTVACIGCGHAAMPLFRELGSPDAVYCGALCQAAVHGRVDVTLHDG